MTRANDDLPWPPPAYRSQRADLAAPATQFVRDREDYLGQGLQDIGRRIADDQVELFVSGDPAQALLQQFERLAPAYIAVHDVGTSASLHLLAALAGAAGANVQRLAVRRQGHGVALAVLQFVQVPLGDGKHVRIYSTDINADTQVRHQIAFVLMARSKLSVLMLGELPPHALATALKPLADALAQGHWPNRDMLLLPLGSATTLAAQAARLVGSSGVAVRVTPQAARPNDAWSFISGAWNRLQSLEDGALLHTEIAHAVPRPAVPSSEAPTQLMDLAPADEPLKPRAPHGHGAPPAHGSHLASPAAVRWADYALRCAAIKGVTSCCVFELSSQQPLAQAGAAPAAERLANEGARLLDAMGSAARTLGLGNALPEAAITIGHQHLLLRQVAGHPGIVLHLVLQASASNLTLARMQLDRVAVPAVAQR